MQETNTETEQKRRCQVCGKNNHVAKHCKYQNYKCRNCKQKGHLANICTKQINQISNEEDIDELSEDEVDILEMFSLQSTHKNERVKPSMVELFIDDNYIEMELDSGAGISVIPMAFFKKYFDKSRLCSSKVRLKCYNGSIITPKGEIFAKMRFRGKEYRNCRLIVVEKVSTPLLGRDLIKLFKIKIDLTIDKNCNMLEVNEDQDLKGLLKEYEILFDNNLGLYVYEKIDLKISSDVKPVFCKPRPIPFLLKDKVNEELDILEQKGVISLVDHSDWGTPLVPVLKEDGGIRICADYKITINKHLEDVKHPLPRIEELFAELQGGEHFTRLDMSNAYNQLEVTEKTQLLLSWSTHRGIYKLHRLPFGTKPASAIFQRTVEKILQGIKGTINFMDDIVVTGKDRKEHLENLRAVFDRLQKAGLKLNLKKCKFFQSQIKYVGHIIDKEGLKKDPAKTEAVVKMAHPVNQTETKAFIGMISYYGRFIPNLSSILDPLYKLLKKGVHFKWTKDCENAFKKAKELILSDNTLAYFDQKIPLKLICDASGVGLGAVLVHVYPDGSERPISFASRTLTKAEENYSVIHKEALSIFWGVKRFYQYLVANRFILCSDHKPLLALFGENKGIPQMAAGRLQRWALFLSGFDYHFQHINGSKNGGADGLSRFPVKKITKLRKLNMIISISWWKKMFQLVQIKLNKR